MTDLFRVSPQYVRNALTSGGSTLLVCAYDDEERHRMFDLEGSIGLAELRARKPARDQEIVFY